MIISINGLSGTGKSAVARHLSTSFGWQYLSAGDILREFSKNRNSNIYEISTTALNDTSIDKFVTQRIIESLDKYNNCILDAHGAALFCLKQSQFSILLYCSLDTRVKRVSERDGKDFLETKINLLTLDEEVKLRFKNVYSKDLLNINHYNVAINTEKIDLNSTKRYLYELIKSL